MNRSRYDNRAKWLNANKHIEKAELPVDIPRDEYWKTKVRSKEDVVTFYNLYYPQIPDVLAKALADYYTRALEGKIALPEEYHAAPTEQKQEKWDYKAEIDEQYIQAKMNILEKQLEDITE